MFFHSKHGYHLVCYTSLPSNILLILTLGPNPAKWSRGRASISLLESLQAYSQFIGHRDCLGTQLQNKTMGFILSSLYNMISTNKHNQIYIVISKSFSMQMLLGNWLRIWGCL